ncbi:MAG TPA: hypothetical protein VL131_02230 [Gammaproteobacteria bacterium]|nr:hypothetical protein [Gammaproteobacteria bacterium]
MTLRTALRAVVAAFVAAVVINVAGIVSAQPPPAAQPAAPASLPPLFFKEEWQQRAKPADAPVDFVLEGGVTPAAVTNAALELKVYDPNAASVAAYRDKPPPRSNPRDWGGASCVQLAGYNQNPPPPKVAAGQPTDPPNLWTGVCQTPIAVTLRDRASYVDLTGLARIRWVTRTSGFHVVRPVVKLADGNWFVGDYAEGAPSANSTLFLESEFAVSSVRWLPLDMNRVVTTGQAWAKPDLSKVDEVGFADLLPGSGHGWGGFVNVGRIEVYGRAVKR